MADISGMPFVEQAPQRRPLVRPVARRLFDWVTGTRHREPPEVREAVLLTLPETLGLLAIGFVWTQFVAAACFAVSRSAWALAWSAADGALFAARLWLRHRHAQAVRRRRRPARGAMLCTNAAWIGTIAAGVYGAASMADLRILVLGVMLAVGFVGYVTSRFAAFPRFATLTIWMLTAALTGAFLRSPLHELALLAWAVPAGGVAYQILLAQTHHILLAALRAEQENRRLSLHDALTGLANRLLLRKRLDELCLPPASRRGAHGFAVLCLDLDGFKRVNDRLGHAAGDQLLSQTAARLQACVRAQDLVARTGGDESVVLLPGVDKRAAGRAAARMQKAVAEAVVLDSCTASVGVSIGLAMGTTGSQPDALLAEADQALYAHKRRQHEGFAGSLAAAD